MEISITVACYKSAKEKLGDALPTLFTNRKKPGDTLTLPLYDMDLEALTNLRNVLKSHKDEAYPKVAKLCKSLADPANQKIGSLKDLPNLLMEFLRAQENTNLHSLHATLRGVAYLPLSVTYTPEHRERSYNTEAYVTFEYCYNSKHGFRTDSVSFYKREAYGTVPELLRRNNLMSPDETMVEDYEKVKRRYIRFSDMHGEMFEAQGTAFAIKGNRDNWWSNSEVDLTLFGKPTKAVLDTEFGQDRYTRNYAKNTIHSDVYGRSCAVPVHPVLPLFSLVHHKTVWVNVSNLKVYEYDESITDKLILPKSHTRLINSLVSNLDALREESEGNDKSKILKAKAQSSIILAFGPPGTGKTLSAEVYAETIKRPLYEIQCAQIGSDPETIETKLSEILARSLRLNMPLLINEADVFIQKRNDNIAHNGVVSVFLRLLEYHTGLVFLTSNRAQDIDDAIKNRCIAMIEFAIPGKNERRRLWQMQLGQFNLELTKPELVKAVRAFPTIVGRDIQNLIRLTHRVCKAENVPFNLDELRHNAVFRGIEVLNDKQIEEQKAKEKAEEE